jgi:tetratricopeptide (TPR) repeat protein
LLQTAASNLPVSPAGVAHMLTGAPTAPAEVARVEQALHQLEGMSLIFQMPDGAWVHRWTAEGLARAQPEDEQRVRWIRAGRYRRWRAEHESHALHDRIEAVRNFLRAEAWDEAVAIGGIVIAVLGRHHQTIGVASFVTEVIDALPDEHVALPWLFDTAGEAHLALGQIQDARKAYAADLAISERLAAAEPERADYQRDLSVSYSKMGDLFSALGQGEEARKAYAAALAIRGRLAAAEPERADYQRDLAVSHDRMGDLFVGGHGSRGPRSRRQRRLLWAGKLAKLSPRGVNSL